VRLLLDSHVVLWVLHATDRLGTKAREAIAGAESLAAISAASVWEISIKRGLGRLSLDDGFADELVQRGFTPLPIRFDHARAAGSLPRHHGDPFDRMLVAQAQLEGLTIVTSDPLISSYAVHTMTATA
jgi:PIN domain nuclease of toxin-antitoxin system